MGDGPRSPAAEIRRRLTLLSQIEEDPDLAGLELELCRRDATHFINNWCWTFDPRRAPKHFPFSTYDFQDELVSWINERYGKKENGLVEKSRDMGATWIFAAWVVWRWLFEPGFSALFGSRKEELVDDWTIDSIFGKLRYLIYRLPSFLRPEISDKNRTDRNLSLLNPDNGNQINGESANPGFGRGGRSSMVVLDEAAHLQHSEAVWASVSDNSDCIFQLSTPNGKGNHFAWTRHHTPTPFISLHWSRHPLKDRKWYEKKKLEMQPWQIAQELDLSYERSRAGRIYKKFDRQFHVAREVIPFNPLYEQWVSWDFGFGGAMAILWGQVTPEGIVQIIQCYEVKEEDIDFCIPVSLGRKPSTYSLLEEDKKADIDRVLRKVEAGHDATHYGDHAGTARTANSKRSCKVALREKGIELKSSGKQTYDWRFTCVEYFLKLKHDVQRNEWRGKLEVSPDCTRFIDCMFNYEWDTEDPDVETRKPKINWASHMVTAFEFFIINRFPKAPPSNSREVTIR